MVDTVLVPFLVADGLFAGTGGILIAVVFITRSSMKMPTSQSVASDLLLNQAPLNGVLVNAGLIFFTFLVSLPGLAFTTKRIWLIIHSWMVMLCAVITLVIGLDIWFSTLKTRANLALLWKKESPLNQQLLQQEFSCCGYMSAPFHQDSTCPNPLAAAAKVNCVGPFGNFANSFLDLVFTAMFGMVALDAILFLCAMMVMKTRAEMERYRMIDQKSRYSRI